MVEEFCYRSIESTKQAFQLTIYTEISTQSLLQYIRNRHNVSNADSISVRSPDTPQVQHGFPTTTPIWIRPSSQVDPRTGRTHPPHPQYCLSSRRRMEIHGHAGARSRMAGCLPIPARHYGLCRCGGAVSPHAECAICLEAVDGKDHPQDAEERGLGVLVPDVA